MNRFGKILLAIFVFIGLSILTIAAGRAKPTISLLDAPIPQGFNLIKQATGVQLFQKDYKNGNPDFVQMVDFKLGASIELLHGKVTLERTGKGAFGGNDARILSQSLSSYWKRVSSQSKNAFCVTNGQFFYMPESPTRLSLPLKVNGKILTDGYAVNEFIGQKLMLEIWSDHVDIKVLNQEALYQSSAPNIIGGLTADANKRIKQAVGRTFIGIDDRNGDGLSETIFIFTTRTAYQSEAEKVLQDFGSDKVMMLDGGGSTQLTCEGSPIIYSERLIPQAVAVFAGMDNVVNSVEIVQFSEEQTLPDELSEPNQSILSDKITTKNFDNPTNELEAENSITQSTVALTSLEDAVWIPTCILPVALLVFFVALRIRQQNY